MARNYFKSYIWLLETLQSHGCLTFKELQRLWLNSSVNEEKKKLAPRTFSNHIQAIADIFGVEIVCDRRDNTYYIDNENEIGGSAIRDIPSSRKYLTTVIQAIRNETVINVTYQSYRKPAPENLVLEPYCLREFKRRWYLYAHKDGDEGPHMFALDRVLDMEIGNDRFSFPKTFNAHEYFAGVYGIRIYPDMKRETVILKVSCMQARYFKSLPLHQSQEVVEDTPEYTVFKYFLTPDYDFRQDVLSFGAGVEVLEPEHVRQEIGKVASQGGK